MYNIGDVVIIKPLSFFENSCRLLEEGYEHDDPSYAFFAHEMAEHCGKEITIAIMQREAGTIFYKAEEEEITHWHWQDWMIEGVDLIGSIKNSINKEIYGNKS